MPGEPVVGCHDNGSSGPQRRDHRVHFRRAMPGEADGSAAGRSLFFSSSMYAVASLARKPRLESICLHSSRFIMSPSHRVHNKESKDGVQSHRRTRNQIEEPDRFYYLDLNRSFPSHRKRTGTPATRARLSIPRPLEPWMLTGREGIEPLTFPAAATPLRG